MRRPPAPGSDGPEQRSLEDKQPEAFAENPTLSASSEQSPLCSGLFLSATEKQAIRPLPCSSSFAKSPARRACTVASARRAARRRYQLFASCERPPPASPKRFHSPPPRRSKVRFAHPFRIKSRSARLFGCKHPLHGSLLLPTFCELREFNSHLPKAENTFFISFRYV